MKAKKTKSKSKPKDTRSYSPLKRTSPANRKKTTKQSKSKGVKPFGVVLAEGIESLNRDAKEQREFLDKHRGKILLGSLLICVAIVSIILVFQIVERSKTFFIDVEDSYEFECNLESLGNEIACKEQTISGTFSNYDTVEFRPNADDFFINGNNFTYKYVAIFPSELYAIDDYDENLLGSSFETSLTIGLWNGILGKNVAEKYIKIRYGLSQDDRIRITEKHNQWVEEKVKQAAKESEERAKKEAEEQARKVAEEQKAKEETERKAAEEQAIREEAERKAAEEQAIREEAERKAAEEQAAKEEAERRAAEEKAAQDNGEVLPDDISPYDIKALCERGFEKLGYTNASISMTNQYAMGYPPYVYVVVGKLSIKKGWTSSRQQVGTIQCQANWDKWQIKALFLEGVQIY